MHGRSGTPTLRYFGIGPPPASRRRRLTPEAKRDPYPVCPTGRPSTPARVRHCRPLSEQSRDRTGSVRGERHRTVKVIGGSRVRKCRAEGVSGVLSPVLIRSLVTRQHSLGGIGTYSRVLTASDQAVDPRCHVEPPFGVSPILPLPKIVGSAIPPTAASRIEAPD